MRKLITALVAMWCLAVCCVKAEAAVVLFEDNFNTISGWTVSGTVVTSTSTTSPAGNPYARITAPASLFPPTQSSMERMISTAGYQNIAFSYWRYTANIGENANDLFDVRWRLHGAGNWNSLESLTSNVDWGLKSWVLPAQAKDASIDIGFYVRNGGDQLNPLTWNDYGCIDDVKLTGERINPVPEPASLSLLGLGLAGLLRFRRKRV